jgi:hypothetical protein
MTEQMMEHLVAILGEFETKMMAKLDSLFSKMDEYHAKTDANHEETMAKLDGHHERMGVSVNAWQNEMMVCQEATDAYPEEMEANPEDIVRCGA